MSEAPQVPRSHVVVLILCALGVVAHQLTHWHWFIEDAAICFAYARNLVGGEGLVPFPGGERVEAYSNPTWIGILALFQALGLDGFTVSKPLAMALGCVNVWWVYRLARRALPAHPGPGALLAPLALAVSSQYAIWSASGLENAWFSTLLGALLLRTVHEAEHGGRPWAAVLALALTWTRPEGLLYAAVAGAGYLLGCWRTGRGLRPVAVWLGVFWGPTLLLQAARLAYFAWPLPNTYYAKIGDSGVPLLDWEARGWRQLRDYADRLWVGYQAPLYVIGLSGLSGRGARIAVGVIAVLGLSLLWPGPVELQAWRLWPELPAPPDAWVVGRVLGLLGAGALLPLLALRPAEPDDAVGRAAQHTRLLCGGTLFASLLFSVASDGDWMGGYRWMSLGQVPAVVLLAVGWTTVLDALHARVHPDEPSWGTAPWMLAALATALWLPPNLSQTRDHLFHNVDETPDMIHDRVTYLRGVARTVFLDDDDVVHLDIDMGAFLFWAPEFHMLDVGKLIDIPLARHFWQQRPFVEEYLHDEHPFHFANIGVNTFWSRSTGLPTYPWWDAEYFELPGYYTARDRRFIGIYARRDLVMAERRELTGPRRTRFVQQLTLEDVRVPTPWIAGEHGYLQAPWATDRVRPLGSRVRVVAFLARAGRVVTSWELPLGYDLYPLDGWRPAEVFRGEHAVPVPADLSPGRYALGFVVFAPEGHVWPARDAPEGAVIGGRNGVPPALARGEVRFPGAVEVLDADAAAAALTELRTALRDHADAGRCDAAEHAWRLLTRQRPARWTWLDGQRAALGPELAGCWARRARDLPPMEAAHTLARAHHHDHEHPLLTEVGAPLSERLRADLREARARQDHEAAYRIAEAILGFQPWRARVRRHAEEARDHRLGLTDSERVGHGWAHELEGAP